MQKSIKRNETGTYKAGAIFSYTTLILNCFISIFFTPYLIRCLGENEYGLYQLIGAFAGYLSILDMGMSSSVTKYVSKYYRQGNLQKQENFLMIMLIYYTAISILAIIIGSVMYLQIDRVFAKTLSIQELVKAKIMFLLLILSLIITLFGGVFRGVMDAYEYFAQERGAELIRVILRVIMIYGILHFKGGSVGLVLVDTLLNATFFLYWILYCTKTINIRFHYYGIDKNELKEVLFFSFFVFLNLIFDQLNWKIDHTILGIKMSTTAVTVYSIGMNFSNYFMNFSIAVKSLFLPKVIHMETDGADENKYTNFMLKTGRMQGYLLFYLYFAFLFLGRQFIFFLMKKDYYEAWMSALLVMSGLLFPLLQNAGHPILQAKNKHHIYVIVCFSISMVNAVSTWFIVDHRGIVGAAFMTMISFWLGQGIFLSWYYHKKIGIDMKKFFSEIIRRNILPIVGVLFIELIIGRFIATNTFIKFILHGIFYSFMYWISIYAWGMNQEDRKTLLGFVKITRKV